jgi:hypothetical protein
MVGIDEIGFWMKRIDEPLTVTDDLMTPGGAWQQARAWTMGPIDQYV